MSNRVPSPTINSMGMEIELPVFMGNTAKVCSFISYTKANPLSHNGHLFSKDASMVELAVAPATSASEFDSLFIDALNTAKKLLPKGAEFRSIPCVEYTDAELKTDPYASVLGCAPSETIYDTTPTPDEYPDNKRYGGIHINLAMDNPDTFVEDMVIKLDYALGLYSVIHWEEGYRTELRDRRRVYGRAGEFRQKDFGFEYRTLPNCARVSGLMLWRRITNAMRMDSDLLYQHAATIQEAINNSDRGMAEALLGEGFYVE